MSLEKDAGSKDDAVLDVSAIRADFKAQLDDGKDVTDILKTAFETNATLADEFLQDEEKFKDKYFSSESSESEKDKEEKNGKEATEHAEPEKKGDDAEKQDVEVSVKIKKELVEDYLEEGRELPDAVVEMIRDKHKADKSIETLRSEVERMKERLRAEQAKAQGLKAEVEAKHKPPKKIDLSKYALPEIGDDDDPYSEEYQEKLKKTASIQTKIIKDLTETIESIQAAQEGVKARVDTVIKRGEAEDEVEDEQKQIDALRKTSDLLNYSRPISEIESDYVNFVQGLIDVSGKEIPLYAPVLDDQGNPVYDDAGNMQVHEGVFHPEAKKLFAEYNNKVKGVELRKKCEEHKIGLPDDFDDLKVAYKLRQIRNKIKEDTGAARPISYDEALRLYAQDESTVNEAKLKERNEGAKAFERAKANRKEFAKETKTSDGANPIDLKNYNVQDIKSILEKPVKSPEEVDFLKRVWKAKGLDVAELDEILAEPNPI